MADVANILIVSDLHFGEELLPGASVERRTAVELGATAFREFLRHHAVRRRDGRPWRLVIAGDLFDFMSVVVSGTPAFPVKTGDERRFGHRRGVRAGVERLRLICERHRGLLADMVRFAASGHQIDIIIGNHDVELLEPEVAAAFMLHLTAAGADARALARIKIVPWFVYIRGTAWIEHGHVYDEGCSFEFNLAPFDPKDGRLMFNVDDAAIRYLGSTVPELDPHGIEEWGFWGYMKYSLGQGVRPFGRLWLGYGRFVWALFAIRNQHRSFQRRDRRRRLHRARVAETAAAGGLPVEAAGAIDRLARTPLTVSLRRLGRMLMLDRFGLAAGVIVAITVLLVMLPWLWALIGAGVAIAVTAAISRWLGKHMVTSQLPMRSVPERICKLVEAPVVVFGHTHDPRWQPLRGGGLYLNSGTWLPATRPGLRRSFTHVMIQPREGGAPVVELRQWRDGTSQIFDAGEDVGAGITLTGIEPVRTSGVGSL